MITRWAANAGTAWKVMQRSCILTPRCIWRVGYCCMQAMLIQLWVRTGFFVTELALQHLSVELVASTQVWRPSVRVHLLEIAAVEYTSPAKERPGG